MKCSTSDVPALKPWMSSRFSLRFSHSLPILSCRNGLSTTWKVMTNRDGRAVVGSSRPRSRQVSSQALGTLLSSELAVGRVAGRARHDRNVRGVSVAPVRRSRQHQVRGSVRGGARADSEVARGEGSRRNRPFSPARRGEGRSTGLPGGLPAGPSVGDLRARVRTVTPRGSAASGFGPGGEHAVQLLRKAGAVFFPQMDHHLPVCSGLESMPAIPCTSTRVRSTAGGSVPCGPAIRAIPHIA